MPNYMHNKLTCPEGNIKEITSFLDGGEDQRVDFNTVDPMPKELEGRKVDLAGKTVATDKETLRLTKLYGCDNWYEWRCQHWGTKWNACYPQVKEDAIIFDTAWSTPWHIWIKLSELFPSHVLEVLWEEEGYGISSGTAKFQAGEVIHFEDFTEEREAEFRREFGITNEVSDSDCDSEPMVDVPCDFDHV